MQINVKELEEKLNEIFDEACKARDAAQKNIGQINALKQWLVKEEIKQLKKEPNTMQQPKKATLKVIAKIFDETKNSKVGSEAANTMQKHTPIPCAK